MLKYIHVFIAAVLWDIWATTTFAATVKNTDTKVQYLIIVEGSIPLNISLSPQQTVTICMKECFITFPNKDRFVIKADDNIEISRGRAIFK
ncbi:hypothetical protein [Bartonella krasnovii]|uniref:hypothetical protein n=1 Tax=Bartonella krasnovii TaxID=2267275 RepID=UPI001F4CCE1D|nr:hypothetical protein [Bartonella krasnovii]UNF36534.1 hypothetical protein MNL11_05305 [Bartonella krasnovii]UNF38166.1 hypothetical protein MNL10_05225 [Bartonella krasnovii]UNF39942.1 hypothetical protein MNL09_05530 [Bartonella krasnovii]UNF43264.1 hypothetical protein MNL07_04925 [Bartonella krasnovii]UNF44857.1 hypothetical protein MNL06_04540 [Bartonella krasnovii]